MDGVDVIIAGAGIIGLSTALELATRGAKVTVLERKAAMQEASWAAAGMLAAHDPENPPQLRPLSELSIRLYPRFLARIEQLSGKTVPLRTSATLQQSHTGGIPPEEIARVVPDLNDVGRQFCWLEESSLDPRDLCAALPLAALAAGVKLIESTPVSGVQASSHGIEVVTPDNRYFCHAFLNCCGAWAGAIAGYSVIAPRKGQMVVVQLPPDLHLDFVIRTAELYLVPRGDGRVVIGASVESVGYDKTIHQDTIQALLQKAAHLWPPVRNARIVETWAGLRPGSPDGLPVLDTWGGKNCWIASGHFRNGILLAPATAQLMCELVLGEKPSLDLSPFHSDRFTEVCA